MPHIIYLYITVIQYSIKVINSIMNLPRIISKLTLSGVANEHSLLDSPYTI